MSEEGRRTFRSLIDFSLIIYLDKYIDVLSERILKIYCRRFDMKLKKKLIRNEPEQFDTTKLRQTPVHHYQCRVISLLEVHAPKATSTFHRAVELVPTNA